MEDSVESKPRRLKRHFFVWPVLIGFLILAFGALPVEVILAAVYRVITPDPMWSFLINDYLVFIGIAATLLIFCALFERDLFRSFFPAGRGGLKGNTLKEFFGGIGIGFIMNAVCIAAAWLHGDLHFSVGGFLPAYLLFAFVCIMIQSSAEELVTRGYIYGAHAERYPAWFAILANSVVFGLIHMANPGVSVLSIIELILSGVSFSLVVYARRSLWMVFGIHTMWNYNQTILFGLPNSGIVPEGSFLHLDAASESILYDTGFGVEGTVPCIIVDMLLCLWCLCLIKKDHGKKEEAGKNL